MKKYLFLILTCLSAIASLGQVETERPFFIYRNDGDINAFYNSEVDSITFSTIGLDGEKCEGFPIQEIWTKDSLYRIPVSAIDSISFVEPQNILRHNAICIDSLLMPYVEGYDTITLYISSATKPEYLPKVGDVLYSFSYEEPLPEGFLGKVSTISKELDNYKIECDIAGLPDIYEKYMFFYSGPISTNNVGSEARSRAQGDVTCDFHFSIPIPEIGGNINCTLGYLNNVTTIEYYDERKHITKTTHKQKIFITLGANGEINAYNPSRLLWEAPRPLYIPIPTTPLGVYIQPGFGLNLSGSIGAGLTFSFSNTTEEIQIKGRKKQTNDSGWHADVDFEHLSLSGEFFPYFNLAVSVGLPLQIVSGGIDVRFGAKINGEIDIDLPAGNPYDTFKDSKVSAEFVASVNPLVTVLSHRWERFDLCVDRRFNHHTSDGYDMFRFNFWERFLFPEFNSIWVDVDENKNATISVNLMRELLFPETVGIGLYDSHSNLLDASYAPVRYNDRGFHNPMELEFPHLQSGMTYVARPIISWLGGTMKASPEMRFTVDAVVRTLGKDNVTSSGARCFGYVEVPDNNVNYDYGICYDSEKYPIIGQSPKVSATNPENFSVILNGLKEATSYWYRAYLNIDGNVYYGTPELLITKKKNPNPDPNPDPDPDPEPIAITGRNYNVKTTTATIECKYENVPYGANCGYFLDEESTSTSGSISMNSSLGELSGIQVIPLSGLKPSTTYYYQAYIKHDGKLHLGEERNFTTEPSPIPIAITGDNYGITSSSATIECIYENIGEGSESWCLVSESGTGNQQVYEFGCYKGTKILKLSDLKPSTTYYYMAYVDYNGETYEAQNGRRSFTTLTPEAWVDEVEDKENNITCTEIKNIPYGFNNVPEEETCNIVLSAENGEKYYFPIDSYSSSVYSGFSNLIPDTRYNYYTCFSNDKWKSNIVSFTTKALSATLIDVTEVEEKQATIIFKITRLPEDATAQIKLVDNNGNPLYYNVSVDQTELVAGYLTPSTTYNATIIIYYADKSWESDPLSFTTKTPPTPVATTGGFSNVTMNSATVTCTFENVPEGGVCGVMVSSDSGTKKYPTSSVNGERIINLTDLSPSTTYNYWAYIDIGDEPINGAVMSFTTDELVPDVVGTWQGTQYLLNGNVYETFTLTLNADGTAEINETGENIMNSGIAHGSWSVSSNGSLGVSIVYYSTDTQWSTKSLSGTLDNVESPSRVEGSVYWSRGHVMGGYADYTNTFVMTR